IPSSINSVKCAAFLMKNATDSSFQLIPILLKKLEIAFAIGLLIFSEFTPFFKELENMKVAHNPLNMANIFDLKGITFTSLNYV
ncbi:MAG: hypothetical protein RSA99_00710, partial [Oscillospiraceae bacterium]